MPLTRIRCSNSFLRPFHLRTILSATQLMVRGSKISTYLYSVFLRRNHFLRPMRRHSLYAANSSVYDSNILLDPSIRWYYSRVKATTISELAPPIRGKKEDNSFISLLQGVTRPNRDFTVPGMWYGKLHPLPCCCCCCCHSHLRTNPFTIDTHSRKLIRYLVRAF
jgi:hypothetical protein